MPEIKNFGSRKYRFGFAWSKVYDRSMYFGEIRNGYRCGWFEKDYRA